VFAAAMLQRNILWCV